MPGPVRRRNLTLVNRGVLPIRPDRSDEAIAALIGNELTGAPEVAEDMLSSFGPLRG